MAEESLFFCPLECGARIKNFSKHLIKCLNKKLLFVNYKVCEYNPMHIIKNELYELHLISCETKKKLEEQEEDSFDDDIKNKLINDESFDEIEKQNLNKNEEEKIIGNDDNDNDNKNEKDKEKDSEENVTHVINRKKKRYNHDNALFKDESEIDKECLLFFNKVYI